MWNEDDRKYGRKIAYVAAHGGVTTAYLDANPGGGDTYTGVNKHTDEPVTVRWDGHRYLEVDRDD